MIIKEKIKLSEFCTMRVGGYARFFCVVKNIQELKEAVTFSQEKGINYFILGGGSNTIFSDNGFDGLIIKNEIKGVSFEDIDEEYRTMKAGAGEVWDEVVSLSLENGTFGLENLSFIPGTAGASAVQNIGAYGVEAKDYIGEVEVFDTKTFNTFNISNFECSFDYRNSIFKKRKDLIIVSVTYKLSKIFSPNLKFNAVKKFFENKTVDNLSANEMRNTIIKIRKEKLPQVCELGSAGSFFKNPIIKKIDYEKILINYPDVLSFSIDDDHVKIPLGYVLDKICGLKGYKKGYIGTYEKQSLVIVNYGQANFEEIILFAKKIKKIVKEKIGILIEEEVEIIF